MTVDATRAPDKMTLSMQASWGVVLWACLTTACFMAAQGEEIPGQISYEARLSDVDGEPLVGEHALEFNFYDGAGAALWGPQVHDLEKGALPKRGHRRKVTFEEGRFTVVLGDEDTDGDLLSEALVGGEVYLGIKVDSGAEITPRDRIRSVPYATLSARGIPIGAIIAWVPPENVTTIAEARASLPDAFAICTGEDDPSTPDFDESTLPNLHGYRFLRGGGLGDLGTSGGASTHNHSVRILQIPSEVPSTRLRGGGGRNSIRDHGHAEGPTTNTGSATNIPQHIPVLFVMRIK